MSERCEGTDEQVLLVFPIWFFLVDRLCLYNFMNVNELLPSSHPTHSFSIFHLTLLLRLTLNDPSLLQPLTLSFRKLFSGIIISFFFPFPNSASIFFPLRLFSLHLLLPPNKNEFYPNPPTPQQKKKNSIAQGLCQKGTLRANPLIMWVFSRALLNQSWPYSRPRERQGYNLGLREKPL